jgi:hypothetical protein
MFFRPLIFSFGEIFPPDFPDFSAPKIFSRTTIFLVQLRGKFPTLRHG